MKYRIKVENGKYYPQYRWMFMWLNYYTAHSVISFDFPNNASKYLKDMKYIDDGKVSYIPYP